MSYHAKQLERSGYIKPVPETSSPRLYTKGPHANILDKAISNIEVRTDGGTVSTPPNSSTPSSTYSNSSDSTFVPTSRAHINGRVVFEVQKIGDMHRLCIPNNGGKREIPLFPEDPYRDHHNTRSWKTKLSINGELVSIEYWEGKKDGQLHIWPAERELVPEQFDNAEQFMISQAQNIANLLSKYAGWRFGLVEYKGDIEFASQDERLLRWIPEDMKSSPGSDVWVDRSGGPREIETNDPEAARMIFEFPKVVKDLENGKQATDKRLYVLETKTTRLLDIVESLYEALVRNAEINESLAEHTVLQTAEKAYESSKDKDEGESSEARRDPDPYDEVMYQ